MEIPKGGVIGRAVALGRRIQSMGIPGHAANAGYFIVLSVFPGLVLMLSLLRYTDLDAGDLMTMLESVLPTALLSAAENLIVSTYAHTSRTMVSVSAVSALWSASRGVYGLLTGLNTIYDAREDRGYFYTRFISVLYTFALLVVLLLTLLLNVFGERILGLLPHSHGAFWILLAEAVDLRFLLTLTLQTLLFAAMYTVLPNRKNRFLKSLPGALLASLGWQIFTGLFSLYVENWAGYSNIYGSVYAVALSMLWLYFCMAILFFGGALNRLLAET